MNDAPMLQEAQGYLAAIVQSADDPIISKDLDGIITSWNPAAERTFGYRADEIIGRPVLTVIPPERADEEKMILGRIRRGEVVEHLETVRLRKDGSRMEVSLTISPVKDAKGKIIGASKIVRDITGLAARMRQQRAVAQLGQLALLEGDLQKLSDHATSVVANTLDVPLAKVLQLLPSGEELLLRAGVGWKEGLVGNMTIAAKLNSQAGFTLLNREPVVVTDLRAEERFHGPQLLFDHDVTSGITCIIMGEDNRPWGTVGAHSRERRQFSPDDVDFLQSVANVLASCVQRELTQRRFRLAFEAAPNGMVMVDETGSIQMVNSHMQELVGYTREEMLGQSIEMLVPNKDWHEHPDKRSIFARWPETRAMGRGRDLYARRKDGSEFPVEIGLNPAETPEGLFILAAVIDISHRKRMEAELAEAHAELAERASKLEAKVAQRTKHLQQTIAELEGVSYSLSHDMRAPLRTIHSFSQILLEESEEVLKSDQKNLLERIIHSAARLDRLIRDVLIYGRISHNEIGLEPLDFERLLRQIIDERPEFHPSHAEIVIRSPLAPVVAHEAYLTQCITNLLDNSVKFVPPDRKPRVSIWSEATEDTVRIYFEDNGPGIPEEARERVFGIFQRVHADSFAGTGIGLAIVRRAAERMGGKIAVEEASHEGTRFCLELKARDNQT